MTAVKAAILSLFISLPALAIDCQRLMTDPRKKEVMEYVATEMHMSYNSLIEFLDFNDHLDWEINFMPNYAAQGREDHDIFRVMIHYRDESRFILFDYTEKTAFVDKMISTW